MAKLIRPALLRWHESFGGGAAGLRVSREAYLVLKRPQRNTRYEERDTLPVRLTAVIHPGDKWDNAVSPMPAPEHYSAGIGAKGLITGRGLDQCGVGYYYSSVNNPTFQHPLFTRSFLRDEWGFEAYYNVALTPWLLLTPDVQVIGPSQKLQTVRGGASVGTATVLGIRAQLIF